ncbi:hypothetical protein ABE957_10930 [Halomonas sp. CS7]|uniref:DUF5655 domain-containing protein n=1 Tax=Halomonas pelophila TaxID=3151122 RepID=A0ABV1N626_9GAMM
MQVCKLCRSGTDIKKSHAIADSVFKRIFRVNSGKAIAFSRDEEDVYYSSDSWWDNQLCGECEDRLNEKYERYSLQVLRAQKGVFNRSEHRLIFSDVNLHKLNMFLLSIFWRAANSGHVAYKNVVILDGDNEYLREALLSDRQVPISRISVKIERLIDKTREGGFSLKQLKDIVISPFCRIYGADKTKHISVCFVFEGFFVQVFVPGLKLKQRAAAGVIHKSQRFLSVPYLHLFDIEEVVELMVDGYCKHAEGKSNIKI